MHDVVNSGVDVGKTHRSVHVHNTNEIISRFEKTNLR